MPGQSAEPASTYVSCIKAGEYLGLSPRTLEKMRTIGGGPLFHKLGRRVVYSMAALDEWATAHSCESTSDPAYPKRRS